MPNEIEGRLGKDGSFTFEQTINSGKMTTIPSTVRERFGVDEGDSVEITVQPDDEQ